MIAVDANVLIGALDRRDALHRRATELLGRHAGRPFAVSVVTIGEVLVGPVRAGETDQAQAALDRMLVEAIPVDAVALAALRGVTGLRMPDCCVLQAAQSVHAERMLTFDDRLAAAARKLGIASSPPPSA